MEISEIKVQLKLIAPILDQVTDPGVRAAINILLNIVEVLMEKYTQQAETIQQLKDEINRLKGGIPDPSLDLTIKVKITPQKKSAKNASLEVFKDGFCIFKMLEKLSIE